MFEILIVEQICLLHFYDIKDWNQALIKTRERLRHLKKVRVINSEKIDIYGKPYGFYLDKRPKDKNFLHVVNRNWGYIYLSKLNNYFKLDAVKNEYSFPSLVTDGFGRFYSEKGNVHTYWFIESDKFESKNKFTKIQQYNDMYEKNEWVDEYWNLQNEFRPEHFPKILVVSDNINKADTILDCVKQFNKHNLEFYIIVVDEIKRRLIDIGQNV